MVPDGRTEGRTEWTDDGKTISLRLRRGLINKCFSGHFFEKQKMQEGFYFLFPPPPPPKKKKTKKKQMRPLSFSSKTNEALFMFILSIKMLIF